MRHARPRAHARRRSSPISSLTRSALAVTSLLALGACTASGPTGSGDASDDTAGSTGPPVSAPDDPGPGDDDADAPGAGGPDTADDAPGAQAERARQVVADGADLVLDPDGDATVLATVEDAHIVHVAVRPVDDGPLTVLVLTRDDERFELRYLDVADGEPSDLFGFPFRLQVDPASASIADVPPIPVWSPDGDRVAWLEWTPQGTRLRTLGWLTYDVRSNPSDERADWELVDVPVGTQLDGWEVDEDGTSVLVSRVAEGERWRIRLEDDGPIAAIGAGART